MSSKRGTDRLPGIAIFGLGNWGTSLAHALLGAGIPLREVVVPGKSKSRSHRSPRLPITTLERARLDAAVLWLCVPDSAVVGVARRIANRVAMWDGQLNGKIVVHSSGVLNVQVLNAVAKAGASAASVHPLMTFPSRLPVPLAGVPFGIEADVPTRRKLSAIIRRLRGRPFAIASSGKGFYHIAGVLASPLLASHLAAVYQAASLAGFKPREARSLIQPIVYATLENVFSKGAGRSFSGPLARGDVATIDLHLRALASHPILAAVYRSLAVYALDALPVRDREKLRRVLQPSKRGRAAEHSS